MKRNTFRIGWVVALLSIATLACTCGLISGLTQAGEGLQTVQAAATELATSGALETVQALATEAENGGFQKTAEALSTQASGGGAPDDIPVLENTQGFFGSADVVSYLTSDEYNSVLEFYKTEMAANGWAEDGTQTSVETTDAAVLYYTKDDRKTIVTISAAAGQTSVQVLIQK
ncbi:MAG: hypothetical protein HYZ49_02090 [Chloroflexi bacterium]|nr:hypothetical protein [Chloroflexota bacterium]